MDDEKFLPFIIRSKLHRPQIHGAYLHRQQLINQLDQRRKRPLTLISAPAGYGKTTLASSWLETSGTPYAWISLDETDNDLRLFLSYILTAIQTIFPDFGRQTLTMVNASTLAPVAALVGSLLNEIDRIEESFILALDDFHLIKDESVIELINQLLHHPPPSMHLALIGRRDPALPISKLRANRLMTEIRTQELRFNESEVKEFLKQMLETEVDSPIAAAVAEKTDGWVTGLVLAAISMRNQGGLDPALLVSQVNAQSVMEYLFTEVFSRHSSEIIRYLMTTAILDRFCGPLCQAVCATGGDPFTIETDGWDFIAWLNKQNLFLIPLDNEKRWFRFHHLFQELLLKQLDRHLSQDDINALHTKASEWFAENGLIEEAIKHALARDDPATVAQLVAQNGFDLTNNEQWPRLERWLRLVPRDIVDMDPGLLILEAWLHTIQTRSAKMVTCLQKAEALLSSLAQDSSDKIRLQGHLAVFRSLKHYLANDHDRALANSRRALEKLPHQDQYARIQTFIFQACAYQMAGEPDEALLDLKRALGDQNLRDSFSQGTLLTHTCFIHWMTGDMESMRQQATYALGFCEDRDMPIGVCGARYFLGALHYERNELSKAEASLVELAQDPYNQYALNFAHSAFILALIYQIRGRSDEAGKVGESVITFALETDNAGIRRLAQAFQAELALRQGHLAKAARWAEQFDQQPLLPMYRFYMPQLTQASVLLAQDTEESRLQAEKMLTQLYDFLISNHNTNFQIKVLTLQCILYHMRGEKNVAFEKLSKSLTLAEPGGFIRLYVDLGPRMAELLKRLQKQNIAVDYIDRILSAFSNDEQRIVPQPTDQPSTIPPQPRRPSPPSQPLVDPLTNRELDVLELIAQRLSNKEIAEKLFISVITVKGHLQKIYGKLDVNRRRGAVEKAKKIGII